MLAYVNAVAFAALAGVVLRQWARRRDPGARWLALAIGSMGVLAAMAVVLPQDADGAVAGVLVKIFLGGVLVYPYALFRFTAALARPPAWVSRLAAGATGLLIAVSVAIPHFPDAGQRRPAWVQAYVLALIIQWSTLSLSVSWHLWRAGTGLPSVTRRRMRVLGAASMLLALALLPAAAPRGVHQVALRFAFDSLPLVAAGLFLVGFVPPTWLRVLWRRQEQLALRSAEVELMGAITPEDVGAALVPHAARILGGRGAVLVDRRGEVLASDGMDATETAEVGRLLAALPRLPGLVSELRPGVLALRLDCGALGVQASAYTPYFGADEISLLRGLGTFTDMALGRAELYVRADESRAALEQANRELHDSLELRRQMVASVSHELRTPITCITGFASTLSRLWDALAEEERQAFVDKIGHHGAELNELVDRLLDFSAAEAGRLHSNPVPLDVRSSIDDVLASLGPVLDGRPVSVDGSGIHAVADPTLVRRILMNLLTNAAKYSDAGAPIALHLSVEGDHARVDVVDHGAGLDERARARVFDPFWRAEDARSRGTGLGLALVKQYVQVMGGSVGVTSAEGQGSTFHFTLPIETVDVRAKAAPVSPASV